jgi:hypothetical protein
MTIRGPHRTCDHPDRSFECQRAIVVALNELVGDAQKVGWNKAEVLAAIIDVADAETLGMHVNIRLSIETKLRKLMKKRDF